MQRCGDYRRAVELLERALVINEREYGPDHVEVALVLNNLGNACGSLGDHGKQKELLERALVIFGCKYGPDHVEVAKTLTNLGNAYGSLGDYGKQKELLERALVINEREYGPVGNRVAFVTRAPVVDKVLARRLVQAFIILLIALALKALVSRT